MSVQLNLIYRHIQSSYKFKQKISIHLLQAFNLHILFNVLHIIKSEPYITKKKKTLINNYLTFIN